MHCFRDKGGTSGPCDLGAHFVALAQRHHSTKPSKMHILRLMIEYLGHMSTPDGTMPTSKHVEAIINMPPPLGKDGLADKTMVRLGDGISHHYLVTVTATFEWSFAHDRHL